MSLPRADHARAALRKLDLLVVSEIVKSTDTASAGPHVLLPAAAWGEKDGTVTNSERRISRQRAFAPPAGDARPDWWAVSEVAKRMGFGIAFDYSGPAAIFREHAALSAFENNGTRDFDLGSLANLITTRSRPCNGQRPPVLQAEKSACSRTDVFLRPRAGHAS